MAHSPSGSCYQHDSPPDRCTIQTFCWAASQRRDPCPKVLSRSPPSTIASFVDFVLRQDSDFSGSLSESSSSFSEASSSIFWSRSSETAFLCQYKDQLTISTFWSRGRRSLLVSSGAGSWPNCEMILHDRFTDDDSLFSPP